jgi:hypothetical protein
MTGPYSTAPSDVNPAFHLDRFPLLLGLALGFGMGLRVIQFAAASSLDIDESMLALNIAARSYTALLEPLDYGQTAPIPFLWAERLVTQLAGVGEVSLRALPFVAGMVLPVAVYRLARRLLATEGALLATAFAALAPILIRYSVTLKPYVLDALITVLLIEVALDVLAASPSPSSPSPPATAAADPWRRLLVAGAIAVVVSQPAIFVLTGFGAAVLAESRLRRAPGAYRRLTTGVVVWGGPFIAVYVTFYRATATSEYMQQYWAASFLSPGSPELFHRAGLVAREILFPVFVGSRPHVFLVTAVLLALCGAGLFGLGRRSGPWAAVLLAGPLAAAVGASALHRYPLGARTMLFAVPLLILMMAEGVVLAVARLRGPVAVGAARVVTVLWLVMIAAIAATQPYRPQETRPLVQQVERCADPKGLIYALASAAPMWAFYATDWTAPDTSRLRWLARVASPGGPAFHNSFSRGGPVRDDGAKLIWGAGSRLELVGVRTGMQGRGITGLTQHAPDSGWAEHEANRIHSAGRAEAWLLFANTYAQEREALLAALEAAGGKRTYERLTRGAWLYRYQLTEEAHSRPEPCNE